MKNEKQIILSLGGSLIVPEEIDIEFIGRFKTLIEKFIEKGFSFYIITGGGKICRKYQAALSATRQLSKEEIDWMGIYVTRLNAEFIRLAFGNKAHYEILINPHELPKTDRPVVVGAGWKPGASSDFDAVELAINLRIKRLVNLSNIEYVYDSDPKQNPRSKEIKEISWKDFRRIIPDEWNPGLNSPFDPIASKKADEHSLEVAIIGGGDLSNLEKYLAGQEFKGTYIR